MNLETQEFNELTSKNFIEADVETIEDVFNDDNAALNYNTIFYHV